MNKPLLAFAIAVCAVPRSQSSSSKNLPLIAAAGFPGDVFVAPQGPLVIVIGRDALGSDRLGTTLID